MVSSAKEKIRPPVEPGDVIGGRYRVERVIASGGMGVIVAGKHVKLNVPVAIKFLHPHVLDGSHARERFLREVRLAATMRTLHVVKPYDTGVLDNGAPYAVMELLDGVDVASYAKKNSPMPISDAVEIVVQACDGMVDAHRIGVIHRDLKPHNLFVTRQTNGTMFVRVLDFGVCKELSRPSSEIDEPPVDLTLTESSVTVGSPLYMAPEQMRASKDAGPASDIWSLGIVLYELLAGRVPFDGGTVTELCLKVVNDPVPPLVEFRPDVPEDLARIVERCLEKDPRKRFDNMAMLAQALEPFASGAGAKRGWQSQVATGDSLDLGDLPSEVATDSSRERLLQSGSRPTGDLVPPSSRGPKRRIFAQGLASGATLTIVGAVVGVVVWLAMRSSPSPTPPSITPPPPVLVATSIATATPTTIATSTTTATSTATATSTSTSRHPPPIPSASAAPSASASSHPFTPPNGAPILHEARRVRFRFTLAALAIVVGSTHAYAEPSYPPDDPIGDMMRKGVALREEGKDAEALATFQKAYALAPRPMALAQVGLAEQALGMWKEAERDVSKARASADDEWITRNHVALDGALETIRAHLGTLEIRSTTPDAEVYVDGAPLGRINPDVPFRVESGTRNVEVRAPGKYSTSRSVMVPSGGTARETIELQPLPTSVTDQTTVHHPGESNSRATTDEHPAPTQRNIGWVFLGTSAALAVAGVVGIIARNVEISSYNDDGSCPGLSSLDQPPLCQSKITTAQTWTTVSILGFVGSGVLGVGGTVLVLTAPKDAQKGAAIECAPTLGISCFGRF